MKKLALIIIVSFVVFPVYALMYEEDYSQIDSVLNTENINLQADSEEYVIETNPLPIGYCFLLNESTNQDLTLPRTNNFYLSSDTTEPILSGNNYEHRLHIEMGPSHGTIKYKGKTYEADFIYRQKGGVFPHEKSSPGFVILGRAEDDFVIMWVQELTGSNEGKIFAGIYSYKNNDLEAGVLTLWEGTHFYSSQVKIDPEYKEGYYPRGKIPEYNGHDFYIEGTNITPKGGSWNGLKIFPLFEVPETNWTEIWSLGVDPETNHPYFFIFYTTTDNPWKYDLWSGQVSSPAVGKVIMKENEVETNRNVSLPLEGD